jgi:hypothetical protein
MTAAGQWHFLAVPGAVRRHADRDHVAVLLNFLSRRVRVVVEEAALAAE